ncbi:glycosyltransferase family 2 protein [Paraflavitalea sp. CAU 1676]|uniref:glycosyltransferase family 2 protein n=1 Tax=Paraflavitalea sp. CAU 1676 TaxID=3032598 RepID=UPI0023DA98F8|nr:glycosyltransferase family 2 protein [Paraflavitalea sp. CAU 1676]MDF2190959.1 glycosyltransferase family 2 protein [Paraflavitalea sp. CAU 1676]
MSSLPEQSNKQVFVVIPVFNDLSVIRHVVQELLSMYEYRIVIVDDGSIIPVNTFLVGLPVYCLRHRVNLGQGAALETGFQYAFKCGADIVVTFDGDGQHVAEDVRTIVKPLMDGEVEVVLGSRFLEDGVSEVPVVRKMVLRIGRLVNFALGGGLLSDAHNGLRAVSREALEKISITENRMAHASEILFEIKRHRLSYREVPVTVNYTDYSRQKGQSGVDGIKILFDLVLHKLFR